MTGRQRVLRALNHQEPDRVPIDFGSTTVSTIVSSSYENLNKYLGINCETLLIDKTSGRIKPSEEILDRFGIDTRMLLSGSLINGDGALQLPSSYRDQWGVIWQLTSDGRYHLARPPFTGQPSITDLYTHTWPDPDDPQLTKGLKESAQELHENTGCAVVMELPGRVFSLGHFLCGFEDWLVNLIARPNFATALLDKVVEIESQMLRNILMAVGDNVDVVLCKDDLGMQSGPLISPHLYRKMIKPWHRLLFEITKSHTNAKLMLHSDGAIRPFIGDFIDLGVDALNPVQVSAKGMDDTKWLKRVFGRHISFWGAIDTHRVLPFGTPEEVKEEVQRRIKDLASGGGYVLASVHNIQAEVPPENICAMLEAAKEYGKYG